MEKQNVIFRDLGQRDYQTAWDYQERLLKENVSKKSFNYQTQPPNGFPGINPNSTLSHTHDSSTRHYLLFVEHPPVYTLGKSGKMENLLISEQGMADKDIEFYQTNRGGDITFHGLQQLVGYPILDLEKFSTDIGKYLRNLEEMIILTLKDYGIEGERSPGETGVWIDANKKGMERKICAIGVRCSRWITMHGFAFNVNTDLSYFDNIIPCGIGNKKVTSLQQELGKEVDFEEAKERVKRNFEKVFEATLISNE